MWIGREGPLDRAALLDSFTKNLANDDIASYVALVDGRVVGALGFTMEMGRADLGMMVADGLRSQGIGTALMDAAVEGARQKGAHKMTLTVWPHNQRALGLYRKFGFEEEGRYRRHWRRKSGELWDMIAMGLVLDHESPGSSLH